MTQTTAPWGKGKNQVLAHKSEIIALLKQGESLESIYHILTKSKKLTIGARTFHRHAAAFRQEALASLSSDQPRPKARHIWPSPNSKQNAVNNTSAQPSQTPPVDEPLRPESIVKPPRTGRTIIPGSALKKSGFNDPSLLIASDDLLDELYGVVNKPSSSADLSPPPSLPPATEPDDNP